MEYNWNAAEGKAADKLYTWNYAAKFSNYFGY